MSFSEPFKTALAQAHEDFKRYGDIADDAMTEAGDMRVVGIARKDTVQMNNVLIGEFGPDLMAGGDTQAVALLAIVELVLATGVHLERSRWEVTS